MTVTQLHRHDPDVELVAEAIRRGYGDAVTTAADYRVANAVVAALLEAGWAKPQDLWRIVRAAGGQVEFNRAQLCDDDPTWELRRVEDINGTITFRAVS